MAKEKGTYSLISVDVAPDEEVVRVDAQGIHREEPRKAASAVAEPAHTAQQESTPVREQQGNKPVHASSRTDESESYDGRDDLEGPVPMAGLQRGIIVAVVLCLVAFIVYFVVSHG